jgi:hypothetical protein
VVSPIRDMEFLLPQAVKKEGAASKAPAATPEF